MSKIKELSCLSMTRAIGPVLKSMGCGVEDKVSMYYRKGADLIPGQWAGFAVREQVRNRVATSMSIARMSVKALLKEQAGKGRKQ